jgi:hypothetical protein
MFSSNITNLSTLNQTGSEGRGVKVGKVGEKTFQDIADQGV